MASSKSFHDDLNYSNFFASRLCVNGFFCPLYSVCKVLWNGTAYDVCSLQISSSLSIRPSGVGRGEGTPPHPNPEGLILRLNL